MKRNFIPRFIEKQYLNKRYKGKFQAVTLFMDIVGFTSMTETLMNYGKEGAEVLSEIINKTFDSAINSIYSKNGWILSFAGDAFTAVFTGKKVLNSISSAIKIRDIFKDLKIKTKFGEFKFNVRIGLSYGLVKWRIISGPKQSLFYFFGEGLDQCSDSEHHCKP
ncbi:adenylate/guanylate cyclase domain-containing protein, partial [Candidatus Dependentiae bacterium]|nr:adenylate/guanylate cyclase domain-containing protein [Candidatus Dependentiae bacterium]